MCYSTSSRSIRNLSQNISGKRMAHMITRMWHGRVPTAKAAAYRAFLNERAIPDYQSVKGNAGVKIFERNEGEITHFIK